MWPALFQQSAVASLRADHGWINAREQREESGAGCPPPNSGVEHRVLETWRKLENHFGRFMSKDTLNKPHHIYILLNP